MAHRNNNRNRWTDRNDNYGDQDRNQNWNRESRQNTSMHQGSWNAGGGSPDENYGLGDTSQGSANYGHQDDGRGSRYYGTGNYGGYFGSGSDDYDQNRRHHQDRRGYEGRSENYGNQSTRGGNYRNSDSRSYNVDNYERGPRYGNSNIHGRNHEAGRETGIRSGSSNGYNRSGYSGNAYDSGRSNDWNRNSGDRYRGYDSGRGTDWDGDRDWWDRTTDEVSSWFGDDDAARRREMDRKYGEHHGKGPKGYTRSDEKIKDDVEEKLYKDSFVDASDIEVNVNEGEVTLSGSVDSKHVKRRVEDAVEAISGVKDVNNYLKVNRTSATSDNSYSSTTGNLNTNEDQSLDQSNDLHRTRNK